MNNIIEPNDKLSPRNKFNPFVYILIVAWVIWMIALSNLNTPSKEKEIPKTQMWKIYYNERNVEFNKRNGLTPNNPEIVKSVDKTNTDSSTGISISNSWTKIKEVKEPLKEVKDVK